MSSQRMKNYSPTPLEDRDTYEEEGQTVSMFDVSNRRMREKILLQRLIVITRLPRDLVDRTELGAHYEKLNFQLSRKYIWDNMTGLLLIYPSCLLHVIESSRELIVSVLRDLNDLQQQSDCPMVEASKILFMAHDPPNRLFQQWSYKVLNEVKDDHGLKAKQPEEEEEEPTESLVYTVLSGLKNLSEHMEVSKKALPESVLDESPEPIISQDILAKLLIQEELQTLQQYLKLYDSPLHISMDFGQMKRSSCLTSV
ncbi:testis-expressed protein 47 isoform X2 [Sphaeramia orbicularis]|uniref:testis-expressed protein 47 isoform X2 n=1 Tax=Sphaeramia orbicularis TaxID=375764 RepID=UPI00117CD97D|nr:testis-expressed protein 47 isoform X2 [Sphaeramia orbicularis]